MTSVLANEEKEILNIKRKLTKQFDSDKEDKHIKPENDGQ